MSYTFALLAVDAATYEDIRQRLLAAGYGHCIDADGQIDMTHIALVPEERQKRCRARESDETDAGE